MRASRHHSYAAQAAAFGCKAQRRRGKQDFVYLPEQDVYRCPANERLIYRYTREQDGKNLRYYWTSVCSKCPLKSQ